MKTKAPRLNHLFWVLLVLALSTSAEAGPQSGPADLFAQGKEVFYSTIRSEITNHPGSYQLNDEELRKIAQIETLYPNLYGILINYYFAKEEPALRALMEDGSNQSRDRLCQRYLELARFAAGRFARCFQVPGHNMEHFRNLLSQFKGKDTVEIVVMSAGYWADIHLPIQKKTRTLSPEFQKQWGLDAAKFRTAFALTKGKGARVAVIDSGIDPSHPVFAQTDLGKHFNFVGRYGPPWEGEAPMVDWGWHGTLVNSIVATYAPEARITVYRTMDADTMNNPPYPLLAGDFMGAAIYKAVHDGNDVINISAGGFFDDDYLREACRYAYDNNVMIVTGNPYYLGRYLGENDNFPGQFETTISVTGIDRLAEGKYGYWEIASPDFATTVGAPAAPFVAFPTYSAEEDAYAPGISCATPIAASLAALVISVYPRLGSEEPGEYYRALKKLLIENADPEAVGFQGFSPDCGYGLINAEKTVRAALELQKARLGQKGTRRGQ